MLAAIIPPHEALLVLVYLLAVVVAVLPSVVSEERAILVEIYRREGPIASLFGPQRAALEDEAKLRSWQCSRRAGKTTLAMVEFFHHAQEHPDYEYAYIALTSRSAMRICWKILRKLNRQFKFGARFRESEKRVELPNGAALNIVGADRPDWMDRLYGQKFAKVWVDESAFYSIDLRYLVDEVLEPTVADLEGSITLMSTPGHICRGLFFDICAGKEKGWSLRKWGWKANPHVAKQVQRLLNRRKKNDAKYLEKPASRRMWLNEWVDDKGSKVYKFDIEVNDRALHELKEEQATLALKAGKGKSVVNSILDNPYHYDRRPDDRFVCGLDIGWDDATAFSVKCWSHKRNKVIELHSYSEREMLLSRVASYLRYLMELYPGLHIVGDPNRKQPFEELRRRYDLPMAEARKTDKKYWIDQYNSDLSDGSIVVVDPESSPHVEEMGDLYWRERPDKKLVEEPGADNDCSDASLYSFRECYHFLKTKEEPPRPQPGTSEYNEWLEDEMERQAEEELEGNRW